MYQLSDHQQEIDALQQRFSNERRQFVDNVETAIPELRTSLLRSGFSLALRFGIKRIGTNLIQRKDRDHTKTNKPKRRILIITALSVLCVSQLLALKHDSPRPQAPN